MQERGVKFLAVVVWSALLVVGAGQTVERAHAEAANLEQVAQQIIERTNTFRQEQGKEKVESNRQLTDATRDFSSYMARTNQFSHTADGKTPARRAKEHGYDYCVVAENIAYEYNSSGFTTEGLAEKFVEGWKHSPEHRKNMLDPNVTDTGVAVAQSQETGRYYAVQMFGRPKSKSVSFEVANQTDATIDYQIADRKFSLSPHYAYTHQQCIPSEVRLAVPNGQGKQAGTVTLQPSNGDRFEVVADRGEYRVVKR